MQLGIQPAYNPVKHPWSAQTFVPNCSFEFDVTIAPAWRLWSKGTAGKGVSGTILQAHGSRYTVGRVLYLLPEGQLCHM
jgi:hypothetical protein